MFNRLGVKDISFSPQCLGLGAPENVINTNQSTFTQTQKLGLRPADSGNYLSNFIDEMKLYFSQLFPYESLYLRFRFRLDFFLLLKYGLKSI